MKKKLLMLLTLLVAFTTGVKADETDLIYYDEWLVYVDTDTEFNEPVLKGEKKSDVTFISTDTRVATVDAVTGKVTILKAGATNITAIYKDESNPDNDTKASYLLLVLGWGGSEPIVDPEPTPDPGDLLWFNPTIAYGQVGYPFSHPTLNNPYGLTVTYSSSDTGVATVNSTSGTVTLVSGGITVITATFAGNDQYQPFSASYTLIVSNAEAKGHGLSFGNVALMYAKIGEPFTEPKLINPYNLPVYYISSDPGVAKVDPLSGKVTLVTPGQTNIEAVFIGGADYEAGSVSYLLHVLPADIIGIEFDAKGITVKEGDEPTSPTLKNPNKWTVTFSSSDETVVKVDANTGALTIVGPGTAIITATATDDEGNTYTASYTVTVLPAAGPEPGEKKNADLWFKVISGEAETITVFEEPKLNNPFNVAVTFSSSDEKVLKVDAKTGEVTIVGPGAATITASYEETDEYKGGSVSYSLIVSGEVTSIESSRFSKQADGKIFSIGGQQVSKAYRGIAIINGKKYYVK